jgi:hypothetical protein
MKLWAVVLVAAGAIVFSVAANAPAMQESARPMPPPNYAVGRLPIASPFVILQAGDTTWIQVHTSDSFCPGDPLGGHGGEATGGPEGHETWCFESDWPYGDSCGTYPPWDARCFWHYDTYALPSQTGINYWHVDGFKCDQRSYCGDSALWCGSDTLWNGKPVECGTWINAPGYGNRWNCTAMLELPGTFDVANGCTVYFDPRYDTECKYDYFYIDFYDGSAWQTLAMFNATSNNPGGECGENPIGLGNPDYWGNTDVNNLVNCNWQQRSDPAWPAFSAAVGPGEYSYTSAPKIRWRFKSDPLWSDMDGRGNTTGGAFIDNVIVRGDPGNVYEQNFESGLDAYWSFPDPDGVIDQWHMVHDPDPPYEGGDGGDRTTCTLDSSVVWRARPENGYPVGVPWRNMWHYKLVTPSIPLMNTGCVVQYDQFMCIGDITCDRTNTNVRFYDAVNGTWCPWVDIDDFVLTGGCFFWNFDLNENVTPFYGTSHDSMQFCFDMLDQSSPNEFCFGKHKGSENIIDNISVGFFDGNATVFRARSIDFLHDMFFELNICAFNSQFHAYIPDTINYYSSGNPMRRDEQFYLEVTDKDDVSAVDLYGTIDGGGTWISKAMTMFQPFDPQNPQLGGEFYSTFCPSDFGFSHWESGTEVLYYVLCTDGLSNEDYFPTRANPSSEDHTGTREDYFEFSIMPMYPPDYSGVKVLLVEGYPRRNYNYSPCFAADDYIEPLEDIYERTLSDAGYCYDKYDITGGGSSAVIHYLCTWNPDYDAVVWFTGPYFSDNLFKAEAQREMRNYLAGGGKVMLLGDRTAFSAAPENEGGTGEDSLGGEFLSGIMGCDYLSEMASPFDKPYIYAAGVPAVNVFGTPTSLSLDTVLIYRECPYLKDMSWVKTEASPPAGYVAQRLLKVLNPDVAQADMGIYVEYQGVGQSVLIDFDLSASINHSYQYCDGSVPAGRQAFNPGNYEGRVDIVRTVLEDVFGLPSSGSGNGGTTDVPRGEVFKWALGQNTPNPVSTGTEVSFEVARPAEVSIKVYDARGRLVRVLLNEKKDPGRYLASWDLMNTAGDRVSSGVYFYKMDAGRFNATRKMLVVR